MQMWELDHTEGWVLKKWCFQTVMLEKALESPWDSKDIKPVNPKGNQPRIFVGRTDAEAKALILRLSSNTVMWRGNSLEKTLMLGKTEGKRRRGQQRMRWSESTTNSMDMNFSNLQEIVKDREARNATVHRVTKCQVWLGKWIPPQWVRIHLSI